MKKMLNFKVTFKGFFIFLVLFIVIAWLVSLLSPQIAAMTKSNAGTVHLMAEKLYTIGLIVFFLWLAVATMAIPILAVGFVGIAISLGWHLMRKFK